jgi:RNA polymerase sigma-70 factor (ECF subfamily)
MRPGQGADLTLSSYKLRELDREHRSLPIVPPSDDTLLWDRLRSGDADAFRDLYARHAHAVQSYCLWRTADLQSAEDATAIVFLEVWRERKRLALSTDTAAPLLLGIATNVLRQQWRSRRRHRNALERIREAGIPLPADLEAEAIDRLDAIRQLKAAGAEIRALPRRERDVLALIAWGDLSYEETASALEIPIGTVRSRLARARARLGDAFPDASSAPCPAEEPL